MSLRRKQISLQKYVLNKILNQLQIPATCENTICELRIYYLHYKRFYEKNRYIPEGKPSDLDTKTTVMH